ncbi:MAG: FprA family A-type flavoprotein [Syntrophobacterales bacterium]|nr:FprA family A-type flavoprotein [Syntrophobacterales bacterium]
MAEAYRAIPITERVYWVGAVDWTLRDFHGYTTRRGSSYNAYLILADRVTLVDTVKKPFKEEFLSRVASVIDPRKVEVIVSNHSEMDHSGCLAEVIEEIRPREVYASPMGVKTLAELSPSLSTGITAVADGRSVSLGNMTLSFMETRMLHWPDSMFTYLQEEKLLFSHDAFGMHLASHERFADEVDPAVLEYEAATYFANILLPYAGLMTKLLARVDSAGLSFDVIAPDHGPVWRRNPGWIVERYRRWAQQKRAKKAVVVYGTMWHSTEKMARYIGEGLSSRGVPAKVMAVDAFHRSDIAYEMLDAAALVVGTSTLNNNMLPKVADVLTYLKGLRPLNVVGAAFGSYGWSGEGTLQVNEVLKEIKAALPLEPLRVRHVPTTSDLAACRELGEKLADILNA